MLAACAQGKERQILLRNGTISTPPKNQAAVAASATTIAAPVSGLYLIQFETAPDAAARASLKAQGAELIKHIPADAFTGTVMSFRVTNTTSPTRLFRVEVRP